MAQNSIRIDERIWGCEIGRALGSASNPPDSMAPPTFFDASHEDVGLFLKICKALNDAQYRTSGDQVLPIPLSL